MKKLIIAIVASIFALSLVTVAHAEEDESCSDEFIAKCRAAREKLCVTEDDAELDAIYDEFLLDCADCNFDIGEECEEEADADEDFHTNKSVLR